MARPRQNKQLKKNVSIRLTDKDKNALIKKFGSIQAAIDEFVNKETKDKAA